MSHNKLASFGENALGNCTNVVFIDARNNLFEKLDRKWFKNCGNLSHVFFGQNKLTQLPPDLFNTSTHLRTIDFSYNKLKKIPVEFGEENKAGNSIV